MAAAEPRSRGQLEPMGPEGPDREGSALDDLVELRAEFARLMLEYQFGIEEMKTKVEILRLEFVNLHEHNPIEHLSSRLKTPESIITKMTRKQLEPTVETIRAQIDRDELVVADTAVEE